METRVLELQGVSVEAEGHCLLRDVSLTLERGELLALTGPSGCGKTTLLRSVAGIIDPAGGRVTFLGLSPGEHGWPAYRRRVVYVSQRPVMLETSIRENLARPFGYRSAAGVSFPRQRAEELLESIGVGGERMDQQARSLSVGQQLRVSFVRALLLDPAVLLLDEPASALDEESAGRLREQLEREVTTRGLSALLVTHDRSEASSWCHRHLDLKAYSCIDPEGADG